MGKGGMLINIGQLEVPIQLCIFLVCCIGPIMVVVGSVLLSLSVFPERENAIQSYNLAAKSFGATTQEFRGTQFGLFGNPFVEILNETDALNDPGIKEKEPYSPFKYMLQVPIDNITAAEILVDVGSPYLHQIYLGVVPSQTGFTLLQDQMGCRAEECVKGSCLKKPLCSEYCDSQNGVWNSVTHMCAVTHYLHSICIKVSQATSSWIIDTAYGGPGCFYKGKVTADSEGSLDPFADPWSPFLYLKNPLSSINVTIRHVSDPQILASFETYGTFSFGEPVSQKIIPGIVILAIGAACLVIIPIAVFFFVKWLMKNQRGVHKSYRNGGLEKLSSMNVKMQERLFDYPTSSSPAHKVHLPPPHIFDIYVADSQS